MKKFYRCSVCGNIVGLINEGGGELVCCHQPMKLLTANTTDAATEKHVPVFSVNGNQLHVNVGDVDHPMTAEHYIQWIMVSQAGHTQRVELTPEDKPAADFVIKENEPFVVYEYCNLHGLWKAESK
ncbi:desulfoferrodoxin [Scatolibacter rhodanostii]|uniref:desulfoferrodoxin n=1 Tax=Scatolibacter rhodanostii TaxID=2014781 RepID=UPI000C07F684|nr:desulfoferrodoxin [Scatolibacter rhodanostii]